MAKNKIIINNLSNLKMELKIPHLQKVIIVIIQTLVLKNKRQKFK